MAVLTVTSGGVPAGSYAALFQGVEAQPENVELGYPAGLRWRFEVAQGPYRGQIASRVTGLSPSPKNACGKILAGMLGRNLQENEQIDLEQFLGKRFMIVVAAGQNGGTRVEVVVPVAA